MSIEDWRELAAKLDLLHGAAPSAIPEYFGGLLMQPPNTGHGSECWTFRECGQLILDPAGHLIHAQVDVQTPIVCSPPELMQAAHEATVSPLLLTLLGIAVGHLDDGRRLKRCLPRVDGAAKDLMLMTVCRLCG